MREQLLKYSTKLAQAGLCAPGEPLLAALDADVSFSRADDPRQPVAQQVLHELGASALLLAEPVGPCQEAMRILAQAALDTGQDAVTPGDCETRTFLHDLPVVDRLAPTALARALARRKGCIVLHQGRALMAAAGAVSPEQTFVTASSVAFACFVAYFSRRLRQARQGDLTPALHRELAHMRDLVEADQKRLPHAPPELMAGPFSHADQARAAMAQAGRAVVDYGLVDSSFGNVSCRQASPEGELLLISQTGSALDELEGLIDPCRMDGTSCVGLTASSEYSAHKAVYDVCGARVILHGHPRFAVVLSMDCEHLDCPGQGGCHRACSRPRAVEDAASGLVAPIVPGEVGAGPYGLCNTLPPALALAPAGAGGGRAAIVYGHGLFAAADDDFRPAFAMLLETERFCRREYFRRVDALCGAGT